MQELNHESDYQVRVQGCVSGSLLSGTSIEVIREPAARGRYRHALFDFDGTVSLIREGWPEVMCPMMVEILLETPDHEARAEIEAVVREFVTDLTGKQTIYQMIQLAEEVQKRGGTPLDPSIYKQMYLDRLMALIHDRREALRTAKQRPKEMLVPGALELLEGLRRRGVAVYLASGTDEPFVKEEAGLLNLTELFGRHVYGAIDDYRRYSKAMVIERILRENDVDGTLLLGFGDGFVEIDNVKSVGGTAIGVASDEAGRSGKPDPWKRDRLIGAGADLVIPDYRDWEPLLDYLWDVE
jgi:phosphoglycolate phosphatase-like HAD superfamily hydrolase